MDGGRSVGFYGVGFGGGEMGLCVVSEFDFMGVGRGGQGQGSLWGRQLISDVEVEGVPCTEGYLRGRREGLTKEDIVDETTDNEEGGVETDELIRSGLQPNGDGDVTVNLLGEIVVCAPDGCVAWGCDGEFFKVS